MYDVTRRDAVKLVVAGAVTLATANACAQQTDGHSTEGMKNPLGPGIQAAALTTAKRDIGAFMELSALLTGVYSISAEKRLNESTAEEYLRRLTAEFPEKLPSLLQLYARLASSVPKPNIDDKLLDRLKNEPEFNANKFVARQIVNIWYFSQFSTVENAPNPEFIDGGFYERGLVWRVIKAHAIGYSDQPFGYWRKQP
jgi:hypothetical protein